MLSRLSRRACGARRERRRPKPPTRNAPGQKRIPRNGTSEYVTKASAVEESASPLLRGINSLPARMRDELTRDRQSLCARDAPGPNDEAALTEEARLSGEAVLTDEGARSKR